MGSGEGRCVFGATPGYSRETVKFIHDGLFSKIQGHVEWPKRLKPGMLLVLRGQVDIPSQVIGIAVCKEVHTRSKIRGHQWTGEFHQDSLIMFPKRVQALDLGLKCKGKGFCTAMMEVDQVESVIEWLYSHDRMTKGFEGIFDFDGFETLNRLAKMGA